MPDVLVDRWRAVVAARGGQPAIFSRSGSVLRTFDEIVSEAKTWAAQLAELGAGAVVGVQIGNDPAWPALFLGALLARVAVLPLGQSMTVSELESALMLAGAAAVVSRDERGALQLSRRQFSRNAFPSPEPVLLKLTSGTTSAARLVRFQSGQLLADCDQICDTMGITPADRNFGVIPMSHSYGFSNLVTPLIARGVPLVASEERMPRAIWNDLGTTGATIFPGMPVFYQRIVELTDAVPLPQLRLCISAGAPLARSIARRFFERFGRKIHSFYGASECGGIAYDARDTPDVPDGFVGKPMSGVQIEKREDGGISVRSLAVGDGYFPDADESTLGGGVFHPTDLVETTADGGLVLAGRVSDVINVAGRKLHPAEIEACLAAHPGVREVVVFGIPSPVRNEEPIACVVTKSPTDRDTLLRHCRESLSPWQTPKDIWFVNEIPTNERGKIVRRALAAEYLRTSAKGEQLP
jgi:long-chain acyl-CoA synthetase